MTTKQLLAIFIPALLLVSLGLFIQIIRYEPLFPKDTGAETAPNFALPILADDIIVGNKNAPRTIIAFEDFSCPACATHDAVLTQLLQEHPGTFRIVWKGLPVARYPFPSEPAQRYGFCAYQQGKFAQFKAAAFANKDNLSPATLATIADTIGLKEEQTKKCVDSDAAQLFVERIKQLASVLGIQSVPTFFINNQQVQPSASADSWKALLKI